VSASPGHAFSKEKRERICLLAGRGVEGDGHLGTTVQHRSRVVADPTQPNLRQVLHLIHAELHDELNAAGFSVSPGALGDNITTGGVDVLNLPTGTRLHLGGDAVVEMTGLRNPCVQLDDYQPGLMKAVLAHDEAGRLIRRCGVMSIVVSGGEVRPGDRIVVELPPPPRIPLDRV
jgi:MOSC domain-containing protein YiiM